MTSKDGNAAGASLGGYIVDTTGRPKRKARYRRRQEKRWAEQASPVVVTFVDPDTLKPPPVE